MTTEIAAMEPVRLEFSWTPNDFVEANSLYIKHDLAGRIRKVVIFTAVFGFFIWRDVLSSDGTLRMATILGLLIALAILALSGGPIQWLQKKINARTFARGPLVNKPIAYTVTEDYIEMVTPDSESKTKWSYFDRWLENENLLLALSGRLMYIFPKDKLNTESELAVRQLLESKIGPHAKRRAKKKTS